VGKRYQDLQRIGSGGMGSVVRAWDNRLERSVAIKVPPPNLADQPEYRQRFLREARAVARLHHDNVAEVYDVPEVPLGQCPIMILEYLQRRNLSEILEFDGLPALETALDWIQQAGQGLQHAHDRDILHRDIKPSNLMLVEERVKVLDFGLATLQGQDKLTRSGIVMGSVPYMAPEQLMGLDLDPRSDEYSLAATTFEFLTGELPFAPKDNLRQDIPRASDVRPDLPASLDAVLSLGFPVCRWPEARRAASGGRDRGRCGIPRVPTRF
jgi:serine/threonine-protein kinase